MAKVSKEHMGKYGYKYAQSIIYIHIYHIYFGADHAALKKHCLGLEYFPRFKTSQNFNEELKQAATDNVNVHKCFEGHKR